MTGRCWTASREDGIKLGYFSRARNSTNLGMPVGSLSSPMLRSLCYTVRRGRTEKDDEVGLEMHDGDFLNVNL